jgi:hypothetical protein
MIRDLIHGFLMATVPPVSVIIDLTRPPIRTTYLPKIAWFIRATTPAVCASERWA